MCVSHAGRAPALSPPPQGGEGGRATGAHAGSFHAPGATAVAGALVWPVVFWMVALLALDGRQYVYRVYAPDDARPGDLFWAAFHCHDEQRRPRASDAFDSAEIWRAVR